MKRILIVDEDVFSRNIFARALSRRGYEVLHADSCETARESVHEDVFDAIVLDRGICGDDECLIKEWKNQGRFETIIIFESLFRPTAERHLTEELNVALVLHKPISPIEFSLQIDRTLDFETLEEATESVLDLEAMSTRFEQTLEKRLFDLETGLQRYREGQNTTNPLHQTVYTLKNECRQFGFSGVSHAIARIDQALRRINQRPERLNRHLWEELEDALDDAFLASRRHTMEHPPPASQEAANQDATILFLDASADLIKEVSDYGMKHMIHVIPVRDGAELFDRLRDPEIDGVFVDVDFIHEQNVFDMVRQLRDRARANAIPLAFMAQGGAVRHRVEAAHAGAVRFLEKPLDAVAFEDAVRYMVALRHADRPKILIIDDDEDFQIETGQILEAAGMESFQLADTTATLDVLEAITPDGVIINAIMSQISGFDICRMLRAIPRWHDLPILFVADRLDAKTRIAAFRAGGDDSLEKPVLREELLARLEVRMERMRLLRERADRDVLTGLYTRRGFLERVAVRLSEARRREQKVALCLLDLDRFKRVNDTYGHIAGDRVLSTIGRLLKNRFRLEDLRCRWGGEELAIALVNEDGDTAEKVLQRVLNEFAEIQFEGDDGEIFHCTFSAGISEFPSDGEHYEELLRIADNRLFDAKQAGRNRIKK